MEPWKASHVLDGLDVEKPTWFTRKSPADERNVVSLYPGVDAALCVAAIGVAKERFLAWSSRSLLERAAIIRRFGEILAKRAEELAQVVSAETGKLLAEARGEIGKALDSVYFNAAAGMFPCGEVFPSPSGMRISREWMPRGVALLMTAYNFPVVLYIWKALPALLAGCTVVMKPSPKTPYTAYLLTKMLHEAGLPSGALNLIHCANPELIESLVSHPDIAAFSFTGSTMVGHRLHRLAVETGHPNVVCELGGKNAVLVLEDANIERAVIATGAAAFACGGQRCTAASRAIVVKAVAEQFIAGLKARAEAIHVGMPDDPASTMGPLADEAGLNRARTAVEDAVTHGEGIVVCGRHRIMAGDLKYGFFMEPTVVRVIRPDCPLNREELFAPVLAVTVVQDLASGIDEVNKTQFGFKASLYSQSLAAWRRFCREVEAGGLHWNDPPVGGFGWVPFGGVKATGVGPFEMGMDGVRFFQRPVVMYERAPDGGDGLAATR